MENASRALMMAAGVLIGVMIISIGVALFTSFSGYGRQITENIDQTKIDEWNTNYLKYENSKEVTIHNIVSLANNAKQNNVKYELENEKTYNENSYYVQVDIGKQTNIEKLSEEEKNELLKANSLVADSEVKNNLTYKVKYYTCAEIKVSLVTKRVIYIRFEENK